MLTKMKNDNRQFFVSTTQWITTSVLMEDVSNKLGKDIDVVINDLNDIVRRKNDDYSWEEDAFSNFREAEYIREEYIDWATEFWLKTRILDKISRINNLKRIGEHWQVVDESLLDTQMDLLNYIAILMVWWDYNWLDYFYWDMSNWVRLFTIDDM